MPSISKIQAEELGYPKHNLQTILINKSISKKDAEKWLKDHGYKYNYYRIAGEHRRFMQHNPIIGAHYYSKKISPLVDLVFQEY